MIPLEIKGAVAGALSAVLSWQQRLRLADFTGATSKGRLEKRCPLLKAR
jgi:hypothetical protein